MIWSRPINGEFNLDYILFLAIIGPVLAIALPWYYALYYIAMLPLMPKDKIAQYTGIFTFVRLVGLLVYPSIYTAMVQVDNNRQRLGVALLAPWAFLGLLCFLWVDWRKGMRQAGRAELRAGPPVVEGDARQAARRHPRQGDRDPARLMLL